MPPPLRFIAALALSCTPVLADPPDPAPAQPTAPAPAIPDSTPAAPAAPAAPKPAPGPSPTKGQRNKLPAPPSGPRADPGHDLAPIAVAFPHPLISEVLFAVPSTGDGDANKDGKREVSGDEFVELVNPHDRSIDLRGYTITDGSPNAKTALRFTFPAMLMPPHSVVVVFNGHDSKIPGPVGDAKSAPGAVSAIFHNAAVFSMRIASSRISFSNAGDAACLKAPDGKPLQRLRWGKADEKAGGTGFVLDEIAPVTSKGSVQRESVAKDASWKVHTEIDSTPFSPGYFAPFDVKPAAAPAPMPPQTPNAPSAAPPSTPAKDPKATP